MLKSIPGIRRLCDTIADTPSFVVNRPAWILRRFFLRWVKIPVVISHKNGARIALKSDPLVDQILWDLEGPYKDLFYPADLEVPPGEIILDIGAHHGTYFVLTAFRFPGTSIIAIEPDTEAVQACRAHMELNSLSDRVELHEFAVAQGVGEGWLEQSDEGSWGNRLVQPDHTTQPKKRVELKPLKDILNNRQPYLVKCNCEGGEYAAIPSLLELGLRPRFITLLVHPEEGDAPSLLRLVESAGYELTPVATSESHPRFVCRRKLNSL